MAECSGKCGQGAAVGAGPETDCPVAQSRHCHASWNLILHKHQLKFFHFRQEEGEGGRKGDGGEGRGQRRGAALARLVVYLCTCTLTFWF